MLVVAASLVSMTGSANHNRVTPTIPAAVGAVVTPFPRLGRPHDGHDSPVMLSECSPTIGQAAGQPLAIPTLLSACHKIRPGVLAERGQFENPS